MEATTKSKADTLLGYVGCEGEKRHLLERAAVAAVVCRGSQAQLGQKLRRTEEMLKGLRSGERNGSHSRIYMRVQVTMTREWMQGLVVWPPMYSQQKADNLIKRAGKGPLGTYQTLKFMSARELSHSFSMELRISLTEYLKGRALKTSVGPWGRMWREGRLAHFAFCFSRLFQMPGVFLIS